MDDYGNGIPAREEPPEEAGRSDLSQEGGRLRLLSRISACAFALYSLLLFLLFLAPVISYSGLGGFSVSVYQTGLGLCTALIVFATFSLAASLFGLAVGFLPALARAKYAPLLGKIARLLPLFFYFLIYSLACSLTGLSSALSTSATAGAAPALILSFTIVFALIHIACLLLPKYKK